MEEPLIAELNERIEQILQENEKKLEEEILSREKFLYRNFQGAANAVAKVYTEAKGDESFKNAAQCVTLLYRDSLEHSTRLESINLSSGKKIREALYQFKNKINRKKGGNKRKFQQQDEDMDICYNKKSRLFE